MDLSDIQSMLSDIGERLKGKGYGACKFWLIVTPSHCSIVCQTSTADLRNAVAEVTLTAREIECRVDDPAEGAKALAWDFDSILESGGNDLSEKALELIKIG